MTDTASDEMALIHKLRAEEGDSVTILCDNPEFIGPSNAVTCEGDWTNWRPHRFEGDSLLQALQAAAKAKDAYRG